MSRKGEVEWPTTRTSTFSWVQMQIPRDIVSANISSRVDLMP